MDTTFIEKDIAIMEIEKEATNIKKDTTIIEDNATVIGINIAIVKKDATIIKKDAIIIENSLERDLDSTNVCPSTTPSIHSSLHTPILHSLPVIFPQEVLDQLQQNAITLGKVSLIGHIAGEMLPLEDIETLINTNIINPNLYPEIQINQIFLLSQGYFSIEFSAQEGADKAFSLSPIKCGEYLMFLHAWTPNFSPPPGEASLLWVLFPELPRIYYPYLEYIANTIGRVVWQSNKATSFKQGFPPKIRILVPDVRLLPSSLSIPLATGDGWFDQRVTYEGMSNQICSKCKNLTIATEDTTIFEF